MPMMRLATVLALLVPAALNAQGATPPPRAPIAPQAPAAPLPTSAPRASDLFDKLSLIDNARLDESTWRLNDLTTRLNVENQLSYALDSKLYATDALRYNLESSLNWAPLPSSDFTTSYYSPRYQQDPADSAYRTARDV